MGDGTPVKAVSAGQSLCARALVKCFTSGTGGRLQGELAEGVVPLRDLVVVAQLSVRPELGQGRLVGEHELEAVGVALLVALKMSPDQAIATATSPPARAFT